MTLPIRKLYPNHSIGLEKTYTVDITQFTGLPIIYLTTNNDAMKEDYVEVEYRWMDGVIIPV